MTVRQLRYFLFPHTVLPGGEGRHLAILLPNLSLIQVLQTPFIPEWAADRFQAYPTLSPGKLLDRARDCYKGYQEMAGLHGEGVDLAALSCDWVDTKESRTHIQGTLRGREALNGEHKDRFLLEAAVFIEMARELDQQEIELETSYDRLSSLEEEFKQIIGIGPEDELEEAVQALSRPLRPEKSGLFYMLSKRITFWLRLLALRMPERSPAFVCIGSEIVEELLDPLRTERGHTGKPLNVQRHSLAVIPSLERLKIDDFRNLFSNLHDKNMLAPYWQSLEDFQKEPGAARFHEELEQRVDLLRKAIEDFGRKVEHFDEHHQVELTLTVPQGCYREDLWKCIDRSGHEALQDHGVPHRSPSALLCLD
jgi:hypothetical protein